MQTLFDFLVIRTPTSTPNKQGAEAKDNKKDAKADESNIDCQLKPAEKVDNRWIVVRKLGEGAFGAVYEANDADNLIKDTMAMKLESRKAQVDEQVLKIEVAVLDAMKSSPKHVCKLYECGRNVKFNYMLMTLLGPSLSLLRKHVPDQKLSMSTSVRILLQGVESLRDMHKAGWIHRDIKPGNFAMGHTPRKRRNLYIFDFGLARNLMIKEKGKLQVRTKRGRLGFRGTMRYCSLNVHKRLDSGRHDDMIGMMYTFLELATAKLPWKDLDEDKAVMESKEKAGATLYNNMPGKLYAMHIYLYTLKYEDKPNYKFLEETLHEIIEEYKYRNKPFDWENSKVASRFWNTKDLPAESSQSDSLS